LVFSVRPDSIDELRRAFADRNWVLFEVGRLTKPKAAPTVYLQTDRGLEPVPGVEWAQSETLSVDQLRTQAGVKNGKS
jgi:hypothetical protein